MSAVAQSVPRSLGPFVALEVATSVSGMGNGISMVLFPWLVLELTGSAAAAGAMGAITTVPLLLSFLFSGVAVDIVGRRRMAVASDILSGVSVALVPLVGALTDLTFGVLAALAVLGAVFDPAGISARKSMLPEAAIRGGLRLERANGINEATWAAAYVLGPGIGGLCIGLLGASATFWIAAVLFAAGALTMLLVRVPGSGRLGEHERARGIVVSTVEGLRFVWDDRVLRSVGLLSMVMVGFWLPVEGVVFPVLFEDADQPGRLGLIVMALSAGGIGGALAYSAVGQRFARRPVFLVSLVVTGLAVVAMAFLPPFPVLLLFGFVTGFAYGPIGPLVNIAMQERSPGRMRGRVVGLVAALDYAAGPAGYLIIGPMIQAIGLQPAFMVLAVGVLVFAVLAIFLPSLRGLDDPPAEDAFSEATSD
ncbi:MAG: MFS transporter [Actinomycetes bacterium]